MEDRTLLAFDFGDAPDTDIGTGPGDYQTLASDNGPRHETSHLIYMGGGSNADDGVSLPAIDLIFTVDSEPQVSVNVTNITGQPATLYGWIDFNSDGVFDNDTEGTSQEVNFAVSQPVSLNFPQFLTSFHGQTYARFRLGETADTDAANAFGPGGIGEVEDYVAHVTIPVNTDREPLRRDSNIDLRYGILTDNDFGSSIAVIGDLDGNGVTDLAVGAPGDDTGGTDRGAVHVLLRNDDGSVQSTQYIASGMSGFSELSDYDHFGTSVAAAGDLDDNGVIDLIVGATGDDAGGAAYLLYLGLEDEAVVVQRSVKITSGVNGLDLLPNGRLSGRTVTAAGDINDDGVMDFAVGTGSGGVIYVLLMNADDSVLNTLVLDAGSGTIPEATNQWGISLAGVGDVDGDEIPDLAVGDRLNSNGGTVDILFMQPDGTVRASTRIGDTISNRSSFGISLAALGDVDGDGVPDLQVGGAGLSRSVLLNPDGTIQYYSGGNVGSGVVTAVASDGDHDGDGHTDVVQFQAGQLSSYRLTESIYNDEGQDIISDSTQPFIFDTLCDICEDRSLASVGNLNGSEMTDIAIGVPGYDQVGVDSGAIQVVFRHQRGHQTTRVIASDTGGMGPLESHDRFGASVTEAGDLNGDGSDDLFVSAPGDNNSIGAVYTLYLGTDGLVQDYVKLDIDFNGVSVSELGGSLDVAGDMNGDGIDDLVLTSLTADRTEHQILLLFMNDDLSGGTLQRIATPTGVENSWGISVVGLGDVDGDFIPDLAVADPEANRVDVLFMPQSSVAEPVTVVRPAVQLPSGNREHFGASLASLGDMDGDGISEIAVGGMEFVDIFFLQSDGSVERGTGFNPVSFYDAGIIVSSLASLGDVDGDGFVELASASEDIQIDGFLRYVSRTTPAEIEPVRTISSDEFAHSLTTIGDLDGNGVVDVVMGAPGMNAVYVLFMRQRESIFNSLVVERVTEVSSEIVNYPVSGTVLRGGLDVEFEAGDEFGGSVASIGDLDHDGVSDLAVTGGGSAYVLLMNTDGSVRKTIEVAAGDGLIESVVGLGDINGDGIVDLALGAPGRDTRANNEPVSYGGVHLVLMKSDGSVKQEEVIDRRTVGLHNADGLRYLGASMATVGDINQDGIPDLAVTEPGESYPDGSNVHVLLIDQNGKLIDDQFIESYHGEFDDATLVPVGDIDGDTIPDLVIYLSQTRLTLLFNNDGSVKEEIRDDDDREFSAAAIGDLNDDGVHDILVGRLGDYGIRELVIDYPWPEFSLVGDLGDAPDAVRGTASWDYNTRISDNGPLHRVSEGLHLGESVSIDESVHPSTAADGDDDDGVVDPARDLHITGIPSIELLVTNEYGLDAKLYGWIDANFDGVFDESERVTEDVPDGTNSVTLVFPELPAGLAGKTYARFRLSSDDAAANPTGIAADGEVEDYLVTIQSPSTIGVGDLIKLPRDNSSSQFGGSVAWLGDLDGDNVGDLAIGSTQNNQVSVLLMNADGTVKNRTQFASDRSDAFSSFGSSLASMGDLDGDGIPDLAVGAFGEHADNGDRTGMVHIIFLNADGTPKSRSIIGSGIGGGPTLANDNRFGMSVAEIGDLNKDGIVDLAVGAIRESGGITRSGAVYVLFMDRDGTVKSSTRIGNDIGGGPTLQSYEYFGYAVGALGDFDGDDVPDLVVGAAGRDARVGDPGNQVLFRDSGSVYVLLMKEDGTVREFTRMGQDTGLPIHERDEFGRSVVALGDLDEDGVTDLAVGAIRDDTGGLDHGAVHILLMNADGTVKQTAKIADGVGGGPELTSPDTSAAWFGSSLATLDDLDGNGLRDLAVGAHNEFGGGAAYILYLTREGFDFGDAPMVDDASLAPPSHGINAHLFLGSAVDSEPRQLSDPDASNDDVQGPINDADGLVDRTQLSTFVAGETVRVDVVATNTSGQPATLYGWIDFNGDNRFEIDERGSAIVPDGTIGGTFSVTFPQITEAAEGTTYARFRISTNPADGSEPAAAAPTGHADDGEVEDYSTSIVIIDTDYGDAPDTGVGTGTGNYNTLSTNSGPLHLVNPAIYLGSGVDVEFDASPSAAADSDNDDGLDNASNDLSLIPGQEPKVSVKVTNNTATDAWLYGWIDYRNIDGDFDTDGIFDNDSERATAVILPGEDADDQLVIPAGFTGTVQLVFPIVPEHAVGVSYARFRLSTDNAVAGPTGPASDGEVEDYRITILANDYGDAPASYGLSDVGNEPPSHRVVEGLFIGEIVDRELSGIPSPAANSDDVIADSDDEDGLVGVTDTIPSPLGQPTQVKVNVTNLTTDPAVNATLYAWLDTNGDGSFHDEQRVSTPVPNGFDSAIDGSIPLSLGQLEDGVLTSYARFRLSSDSAASDPTAPAYDGEVEDYRVAVAQFDYGDAPDPGPLTGPGNYRTTDTDGGPVHQIDERIYLGALPPDGEFDSRQIDSQGRQILSANGDDNDQDDDEDGLVNPAADLSFTVGYIPTIHLRATNLLSSTPAAVHGWVDFNMDGDFLDPGEHAYATIDPGLSNVPVDLHFPLVSGEYIGVTYARFRISTDYQNPATLPSTGFLSDGEVEDYVATIAEPADPTTLEPRGLRVESYGHYHNPGSQGYGTAVAAYPDVGDSTNNFVIGVPGSTSTGGSAPEEAVFGNDGKVRVLFHDSTGEFQDRSIWGWYGQYPGSRRGHSVAVFQDSGQPIKTYLALGRPGEEARIDETGSWFRTNKGEVQVLSTKGSGSEFEIAQEFYLSYETDGMPVLNDGDEFGYAVTHLGLLDNDSVPDLAVSAVGHNDGRGIVYVLLMNADGTVKSATPIEGGVAGLPVFQPNDHFGLSIANLGEQTIAIGSGEDGGRGAVYIASLTNSGSLSGQAVRLASGVNGMPTLGAVGFGTSVAGTIDLDGNSTDDLIIGAPGYGSKGGLFVTYMNADGSVRTVDILSAATAGMPSYLQAGERFGASVAVVHQSVAKGTVRIAAGSPAWNGGEGRVFTVDLRARLTPTTLMDAVSILADEESEITASPQPQSLAKWLAAVKSLPEFPRPNEVVTIVLKLAQGNYTGKTIDVPNGYQLVIDGSSTSPTFTGASPALTIVSGDVLVTGGVTFTNATDAPTILVMGGTLTLRDAIVTETATASQPAIEVLGGSVDLGTAADHGGNAIIISGAGALIHNANSNPVAAIGNTYQIDDVAITSNFDIEKEISDALDGPGVGLVTYVPDNVYLGINAGTFDIDLLPLVADLLLTDPRFLVTDTTNGSAEVLADNRTARFMAFDVGTASFSYAIIVDEKVIANRVVNFDVTNVAPTLDLGNGQTANEGDLVSFDGAFTDPGLGQTHTFRWQVSASNGQVISDSTAMTFSFRPNDNGLYTVTYTVTDDAGAFGTDNVVIMASNVIPTANPDSGTIGEDSSAMVIDVLNNDNDPASDHDPLTITAVNTVGTVGLVTFSNDIITYDPNDQFESLAGGESIVDIFTYSISDGDGGIGVGTVTVTVSGANDAPTISTNNAAVAVNEATQVSNSGTFADVDAGDSVVVTASLGNIVQDTGVWNWIYDATDDLTATVTVTATDEDGVAAITTFDLSVHNVVPTAMTDSLSVNEDATSITVDVLANDTDPAGDSDPLSITGVDTTGTLGLVTFNVGDVGYSLNGQFESLAADESIVDTFTYSINDGDGGTSTSTVSITVNGMNDAPTMTVLNSDHDEPGSSAADGIVSIDGLFADIDLSDTHAATVDWGDGSPFESLLVNQLADAFTGIHTYSTGGIFEITVAIDDGKGGSDTSTTTAVSQGVGLVNGTLYVIGTNGRDHVNLKFKEKKDELKVDAKLNQGHHNGGPGGGKGKGKHKDDRDRGSDRRHEHIEQTFEMSAVNRIVAYLGDGDDHYDGGTDGAHGRGSDGGPESAIPQIVFGGTGNDHLMGGRGNDVLFGGDGKDHLFGDRGADVLIGGDGKDKLDGGRGDDLLIGGQLQTDWESLFDVDAAATLSALDAAMTEWATGNLANTMDILGNVLDDNDKDDLFGGKGTNTLIRGAGDKVKKSCRR